MQKNIFSFILCFVSIQMFAQLKAEAGNNLYLCDSLGKSVLAPLSNIRSNKLIGGYPAAFDGIPPYKYRWHYLFKTNLTSKPFINASDLLTDTAVSNPSIKENMSSWYYSYPNKTFTLKLEVTDSIGSIAKDSVDIIQSLFNYKMVSERYKLKSDTISFESNIGKGVQPLKFSWSPPSYILDPSQNPMRTFSPSEITYYSSAIDSLGCKANDRIDLKIFTTRIQNHKMEEFITNFHNPVSHTSVFIINKSAKVEIIEVYNYLVQKIYSQETDSSLEIGKIIKEKGLYTLVFFDSNNKAYSFKIEKD